MFGFQTPELVVILVIVLLLFGAKRLSELARSIGSVIKEYREASDESGRKDEAETADEKRMAILQAARKLGIKIDGKNLNEIAQEIASVSESNIQS